MKNKGKLSGLFHNEFIKSLASWITICGVIIFMIKSIIQFYNNAQISLTLSLVEILIAAAITSAILSVWALAKAKTTRKSLNLLADLMPILKDQTYDLNERLKILEDIESKRFKLKE